MLACYAREQPQIWIDNEDKTDAVFDSLHRCEDPAAAGRALSAVYSAISKPDFSLRLPSRKSGDPFEVVAAGIGGDGGGGGGGDGGPPSPRHSAHEQVPPFPAEVSPVSSVTALFCRVFSLLDGLGCWRLLYPQLRELIALNPSAFAGAVIARAAIALPTVAGAHGGLDARAVANASPSPATATGAPGSVAGGGGGGGGLGSQRSGQGAGGQGTGDGVATAQGRAPPVGTSSFVAGAGEMPGLNAYLVGGEGGEGRNEDGKAGGGDGGGGDGGGIAADSWRMVAGETLAGAMPDVARGRMQGARGCCAVADPCSPPGAVLSRDAAYSPLPLMVRALQDVVGDLQAARMVRDAFSWVMRGERELADAETSTLAERERRLDQLGSLVWSLGDLRRSLPLHHRGAAKAAAASGGAGSGGDGASGSGGGGGDGGGGGGDGGVSFMRVVVEQMEVHLVRVLDSTASAPLPACPFASFKMDSGYACEHDGWRGNEEEEEEEEEGEGGHRGCVTCKEVVKPFLDNPFECWTSWVPWDGTDGGDGFSPAFYQRLGLRCSVEGGAVKVRGGGIRRWRGVR